MTRARTRQKPPAAKKPSPFIEQYLGIKARHPEALLFFRMGDFYELFFEDAVDAAAILDITLTARGEYEGKPIPMAGVPFHAAEGYLARLIKSGRTIAVCEQMEKPEEAKKRGSKAIVHRDIVRIVTPGTVTEEAILPPRQGQALVAIGLANGGADVAIAHCDVSTGNFEIVSCTPDMLANALAAIPAREILMAEKDADTSLLAGLSEVTESPVTVRPSRLAAPRSGERLLQDIYGLKVLDGFGAFNRAELSACALLLEYIKLTQAGGDIRLDRPCRAEAGQNLAIDPATRSGLEIDQALAGGRAGSLLASIDRTLTPSGARLLASQIARPSLDRARIEARQDAIAYFLDASDQCQDIRAELRHAPDLERARGRLRLGRGGPRDLVAIGAALRAGERAAAALARTMSSPPALISEAVNGLTLTRVPELGALAVDLGRALNESVPVLARDGGFIATGWDPALDEIRALKDDSRKIIAELQKTYMQQTGISALKIKFNNVLGYFIDLPSRHAEPLMQPPLSEMFIHRQTLASATRFSTTELSELAGRISRAEEEALARELGLFADFARRVEDLSGPLTEAAGALAMLDVATANAIWADETGACRPVFAETAMFRAEGLRHPVVEAALKKQGDGFTANDLELDADGKDAPRFLLVTGPNMAGKSTYLRQSLLAVILAQAGCYVPARSLTLGIVDRIFSRVGASDDLARGRSTFMVEMVETAAILNQATPQSFVILDEVGRGTSTYDGLAIAWAAVEHLHNVNSCRALFATHYHELTTLAGTLEFAANASLKAKQWKDELVFLHEVIPGPAESSYGVQVARLAGLPKRAVRRAEQVLKQLEADPENADTLPLFAASLSADTADPDPEELRSRPVMDLLDTLDPDALTPKEALEIVYRLKRAGTE